tara:strand:+ start:345 stop:749 length:405 start_codon:yes stop_codon:yes gene_type:complete
MLSVAGTIVLTGAASSKQIASVAYTGTTKIGGGGTTPATLATGTGADVLGGSTTIFKQLNNSYLYTSNFIQVNASKSSNVITFAVTLSDNDPTVGTDQINGTLTMTTTIRNPSTSNLTASWGTVTQNAATWSLS